MTTFPRSEAWQRRALDVIPLGVQTLSKSASQWVEHAVPLHAVRADGSRVWDVDGNEWIDWPMALGPVLLGHRDPEVDEAIRRQLDDGITFTLSHPLEVEVAERIVGLCPGVDQVRFAKSGSDAVSAAVRAARALTERDLVLAGGYHGWHDWYIGSTTRDAGVPKAVGDLTLPFRVDDLDHLRDLLERHPGEIAAVVLEPSGAHVPAPGHLEALIDLTRSHGALCVFDEVITGFRLAPGGARERYGVEPDFSCYGKALGNGMPISAVAGSRRLMAAFDEVFFSGTHGGEALSLAAARAVLDRIASTPVLADIEARGADAQVRLKAAVERHGAGALVTVTGEPQRSVIATAGDDALVVKSWLQQELAAARCLFNGSVFICGRHTDDDVDTLVDAFDGALATLMADPEAVGDRLVGAPLAPVFRAP